MLPQRVRQRRMLQHRDDLVRHLVDVPEIHLQRIMEHLAHTALLAHNHRHIMAHRFQRRDAERLAHARHHIQIGHLEYFFHIAAA